MAKQHRWPSLAHMARHFARRQDWTPLREAAALYRVTPETMLNWVRQGRFTSCEFDEELWISHAELHAALRRNPGTDDSPIRR